jgi:hypothetical protein
MSTAPDFALKADLAFPVLQGLPDGVIVVDDAGVIRVVNPAAELMFGYTEGELVGKAIELLVPEAVRDRHDSHRAGFMMAPRNRLMAVGLELAARRKGGELVPVDINLAPVVVSRGIFVAATVRRGQRTSGHGS